MKVFLLVCLFTKPLFVLLLKRFIQKIVHMELESQLIFCTNVVKYTFLYGLTVYYL